MARSLQEIIGIAGRRPVLAFGRWDASIQGQELAQDIIDALETINAELQRHGEVKKGP